ncbi:hypothetical protein [Burkholderia sp. Ac-20365]|nr:hypothetical protein [Burkholderia sp. Ac-20365]
MTETVFEIAMKGCPKYIQPIDAATQDEATGAQWQSTSSIRTH